MNEKSVRKKKSYDAVKPRDRQVKKIKDMKKTSQEENMPGSGQEREQVCWVDKTGRSQDRKKSSQAEYKQGRRQSRKVMKGKLAARGNY